MNVLEVFSLLRKYWIVFVVVLVVCVVAVLWHGSQPRYDVSLTIFVNRLGVQETDHYKYGGFYETQANEQFAGIIRALFLSPEVVRDIFETANISTSSYSLRKLSTYFKADDVSFQQVEVRYTHETKEGGEQVANAITDVVSGKTEQFNDLQNDDQSFTAKVLDPVIVQRPSYYVLRVVLSLIVGVIIALVLAFAIEYLRDARKKLSSGE